tara:strand:+ start:4488 stop:5405 length:918 start_codon:yes stop_codon:yes gene_type:complete
LKKIAAFTKSSLEIGNGHLVRLSQMLSCLDKKYFDIDFYCDYEVAPSWFNDINHINISIENFFKLNLNKYGLILYDSYLGREKLNTIKPDILLMDDVAFHGNNKFVKYILDYNYGTSESKYTNQKLFLGPKYFPIGKNTYPEFVENSSFKVESKNIIISSGGVSDTNLLNLSNLIDKTTKFGNIYLMDPLSKLKSFESSKVNVIQNESLSKILNNLEFKFGIFAGGTSKYISAAFSVPSFFIGRNKLEFDLIKYFEKDNLSLNIENLFNTKLSNLENNLISVSENLNKLISKENDSRINTLFKNL